MKISMNHNLVMAFNISVAPSVLVSQLITHLSYYLYKCYNIILYWARGANFNCKSLF